MIVILRSVSLRMIALRLFRNCVQVQKIKVPSIMLFNCSVGLSLIPKSGWRCVTVLDGLVTHDPTMAAALTSAGEAGKLPVSSIPFEPGCNRLPS